MATRDDALPDGILSLRGLGAPARRALIAAGYQRLDDLAGLSDEELLAVGPKAVTILRAALNAQKATARSKTTTTKTSTQLVFMPSLVSLLLAAEEKKGAPLSEREVLSIRANAACTLLPKASAIAVTAERGYDDIDAEHCWKEWRRVRVELIE